MSFQNDIFHNNFSVYTLTTPPIKENLEGSGSSNSLITDISNILFKYDNIKTNIDDYNAQKDLLIKNKNSDFGDNKLDYTNQTKTFYDGTQEDVQVMLLHQYNMYMAGLITTATLIVFAILMARE